MIQREVWYLDVHDNDFMYIMIIKIKCVNAIDDIRGLSEKYDVLRDKFLYLSFLFLLFSRTTTEK